MVSGAGAMASVDASADATCSECASMIERDDEDEVAAVVVADREVLCDEDSGGI